MAWTEITHPKYRRRWAALRKRYDGRGVGGDGTASAVGSPARTAPRDLVAHGGERDLLHRPELLPVAAAAEGFPAIHDGAVG
jgi:hypothetical protein